VTYSVASVWGEKSETSSFNWNEKKDEMNGMRVCMAIVSLQTDDDGCFKCSSQVTSVSTTRVSKRSQRLDWSFSLVAYRVILQVKISFFNRKSRQHKLSLVSIEWGAHVVSHCQLFCWFTDLLSPVVFLCRTLFNHETVREVKLLSSQQVLNSFIRNRTRQTRINVCLEVIVRE
jgi:hypothetical protein